MTLLRRKLLVFLTRYFVPAPLEHDLLFRAMIRDLSRRGMAVLGVLGVAGVVGYLAFSVVAGREFALIEFGLDPVDTVDLWNKLLVLAMGLGLLALSRTEVGARYGRTASALFLLVICWMLIDLHYPREGPTNLVAGWLTLTLMLGVGAIPFQPWQTSVLVLGVIGTLGYYAELTPGRAGDIHRVIFLVLVMCVAPVLSSTIYVGHYRQYRALRRIARLKSYLSARSQALERALERERAMQDQLIQSEKLASLGQLTAGIAHEIKNPLNFVNNFAALSGDLVREIRACLEEDPDRPTSETMACVIDLFDDLTVNTEKIAEHGRRADGIVRSMLAHSRSAPGDRRAIDLNRLLEEYAGLAYHGMRALHSGFQVEVEKALDPRVGEVHLVPEEVGRVFINLLDNAFDAVRTRKEEEPAFVPKVRVATRRLGDRVEVRVSDNGIGMEEEVAARVFEPFFTTKPAGAGTGLGLSLTYEIVTKGHGGTLEVASTPGEGTTFTMTLPDRPPSTPDEEDLEDAARPDDEAVNAFRTG
ncbi:MAG TPA: ATP-binding protein [Rubricoccaceae bacterium]|nr:ATP-binding protein [Rubricoccaceae bacterium]